MRPAPEAVGPIGRLGRWTADHVRTVAILWVVVLVGFGFFAPKVETALSGAGWQANGSESVQARQLIQANFAGLSSSALMVVVHSPGRTTIDPTFRATVSRVEQLLRATPKVASIVTPRAGSSISADGHTAIVLAGAEGDATAMVAVADKLKSKLHAAGTPDVGVSLTGASGMWSDFNTANRTAMMRSELFSWPVTLAILVLAFGSLVAAGLPLMLTILGLVASAGLLSLLTHGFEISIWAMNFALMFALALGIDYALFVVNRFRGAYFGSKLDARDAVAVAMDTAGKAVLFSGVTVLISLSAVMLVPSPPFRSMALGIMLSVLFVLAATLTLLPRCSPSSGRGSTRCPFIGCTRASTGRRRLPAGASGSGAVPRLRACGDARARPSRPAGRRTEDGHALDQGGAEAGFLADRLRTGSTGVRRGCPGTLQIVGPRQNAAAAASIVHRDSGIASVSAIQPGDSGLALIQAIPNADPSSTAVGRTIDRLRLALPAGVLVGGASAENHDLEQVLAAKTPLVIGVVLALGFLLLLVALQAPLIAALGVATNLLATGAAFGIARLVFQNGHGSGFLGFEPQGFLDAWGPVFFFAMIFAISMDYTVFLLSSAKEHYDKSGDPRDASINGLAHSGRVIFAAAAVMVAVFFTFALSGPLPPKEMGVILGVAVLLDAMLVRLILIPTLLRVFGHTAWASPRWLVRILPNVKFGHV